MVYRRLAPCLITGSFEPTMVVGTMEGKPMPTLTPASTLPLWFSVLAISIAFDAGATAYLKVAGDRLQGFGFFWATVLAVAAFAPSIMTFGYAMKIGPSYIATVGIWAVGVYAANAVVGVMVFGDPFSWRTVLGVTAACASVILLKPAT